MPRIPFSIRRSGRYYFRRHVCLHNGKDINVIVPLSICDGQEARERATILAAQFDRVRCIVNAHATFNNTLAPATLKMLFEAELRSCLARLVTEFHEPSKDGSAGFLGRDMPRPYPNMLTPANRCSSFGSPP